MLAVFADFGWELAATYFNNIRSYRCRMMLETDPGHFKPCRISARNTANISVTVDSTGLHYLI
jgi:hypothetical protein